MKKKFILGNCYLNDQKVPEDLEHLLCEESLRKVGQGILELLIGNGFGTFDPGDLDL